MGTRWRQPADHREATMGDRRDDPEVQRLWEEFHGAVTMTSNELRDFLLARSSGPDGVFTDQPDLGLPELGRHVVRLLGKRKVDLTPDDLDAMRRVVGYVRNERANPPPAGERDGAWRESLMSVGHDALRPPRTAEPATDLNR